MSIPVCKFYILNQTCRFGKNCRYSHSSQRPPPDRLFSDRHKNDCFVKDKQKRVSNFETNTDTSTHSATESNGAVVSNQDFPSRSSVTQSPTLYTQQHAESEVVTKPNKLSETVIKGCRHFASNGNCYFGKHCRFSHTLQDKPEQNDSGAGLHTKSGHPLPPRFREKESKAEPSALESNSQRVNVEGHTPHVGRQHHKDVESRKICRFFLSYRCYKGSNCSFLHPRPAGERRNMSKSTENHGKVVVREVKKDFEVNPASVEIRRKQVMTMSELDAVGVSTVREWEVNAIKKRFPQDKITVMVDTTDQFSARVPFKPTDPDWPFDVKLFELLLTVSQNYPQDVLCVKLPTDQNMPETVRRYTEITIKEWLDDRANILRTKGKVELVLRPFLRWLDRSLEDITTEALKQFKRELVARAAGIEFFSPAQLQDKLRTVGSEANDDVDESDDGSGEETSSEEELDSLSEKNEEDNDHRNSLNLNPEKKGTQIELRHLQLKENASALLFDRLKLVIQCGRCKNHADIRVEQSKVVSLTCSKCSQPQFVHYHAALLHPFSSVLGYLDLDGCLAFDLIFQDSRAVVTCLGCSKNTRLEGLVTGQMVDGWCQACNSKFKIATEAVKFAQLAPSGISTERNVVEMVPLKTKKLPKDPSIREGYPLPEFGTCKHYKHSYRWLRFPCCGKAYPCDVCHDKKEDHEMTFATRMICGHCCREQNFSATRPCSACGQHVVKVRSSHWEGGSGCRDKIAMSRNDQQKYRNLYKTQSNHKKKIQSGGKKNTKLRHT